MAIEQRKVLLTINGVDKIPAVYVAEVFQRLQNILYTIGDQIEGNEPRSKGDFPQSVKENCSLVITGLSTNSVHAQMLVGTIQESLPEMQTTGERAFEVVDNFLQLLTKEDVTNSSLYNLINNNHRLNRILREFDAICPEESELKVGFEFGGRASKILNRTHKKVIRSLLQKTPSEYEKEVDGRIFELRVDKKRQFQIDSTDGLILCQYTPEIEDVIVRHIGKLVKVRGTMKPTQSGKYILDIVDETFLNELTHFPVKIFKTGLFEKQLKEPILIEVVFENEQYVVSNEEFGLFVVAPTLKSAIGEIQDELAVLWAEYVDVEEYTLTEGAKQFREKLLEIVK